MAALGAAGAAAQTYGIATMQPGTLNHTIGSAIAKTVAGVGGRAEPSGFDPPSLP